MATPLHCDCVGCHARTSSIGSATAPPLNGEEATLVILAMLVAGIPLDQLCDDLCFAHRRQVEDTARVLA